MLKKIKCITIAIFISCLCLPVQAKWTHEELQTFNKRLTTKKPLEIYQLVSEIHARGESHPLIINGLRRFLNIESLPFRHFIAETLAKLNDPVGIAYFKSILENSDSSLADKVRALRSLGQCSSEEGREILHTFEKNDTAYIRLAAQNALIASGVPFSPEELLEVFKRSDPEQKKQLLYNTHLHEKRYISLFEEGLKDSNKDIAFQSLRVLQTLAESGGIDTMYANITAIKNPIVRLNVEFWLAREQNQTKESLLKNIQTAFPNGFARLYSALWALRDTYPEEVDFILDHTGLQKMADEDIQEREQLRKQIMGEYADE